MKKILLGALLALTAAAHAATKIPVQMLDPTGSASGQTIVSTGPAGTPAWGGVAVGGLAPITANTVVANATGATAAPTAVAVPSCSGTNSALRWTSGSGFTCASAIALTSSGLNQFASTTSAQLAGIISDETGTGSLVFGTNPTIAGATVTGTLTVSNLSASGTIAGISGRLLNVQTFVAGGTYAPTTGANRALVCGAGGGGAGGGASATGAGQASIGGGGSAGAFGCIYITAGLTSQTVTIGAAGTGVSGGNGGSGGQTSFGSLMILPGGPGGGIAGPTAAPAVAVGTGQSAAPSGAGTYVYSSKGVYATHGMIASSTNFASGTGASSSYGAGGPNQASTTAAGSPASGNGAGGGGAGALASAAAQAGGDGSRGIVIVYEYQ
ncbi:hypothetical protein [Burkholderia anthina]|uniref:hypothetical protein n=1 Tax=Burkholderia anthina TaxID=179879 RepID=UPI0007580766|nr:hypothetical protein [Burkholderia anthina]KWH61608.1 hypothetical protein WT63_18800 [Burkholderia anthina]